MTSMPSLEPDLAVAMTTPKPPLLKRLVLLTAAIVALVFIGLYANHWWTAGRFIEKTGDAYIGGDITAGRRHFQDCTGAECPGSGRIAGRATPTECD